MAATPVPSFAAPPDFPALSDRALGTYNSKAFAWATAWQGTTGPNVHAIAATAYANAQESATQAELAVAAGVQASASASVAVAAANFKGEWPALTGALSKPACVKHNGRFWMLLNNLADVALSEPGPANADWTPNDAGVVPSQTLTVAGASVTAVTGVRYILAANNIALTAPVPTLKGDYHGVRRVNGVTGCTWIFGATKVRGSTPGTLAIDVQEQDLVYEDNTWGYV